MKNKVRFAPSPTGNLHIGGVRTALFNYLYAKKNDGDFLVRIEDTDPVRSKKEYQDQILNALEWLGLTPDAPYVIQSENNEQHQQYFQQLIDENMVYPCFCSKEKIAADRQEAEKNGGAYQYPGTCRQLSEEQYNQRIQNGEPFVYRFKNDPQKIISWNDLVRGEIKIAASEIDDFILRRVDGSFTYQFCVVCDDISMEITRVIRGEDHISNTPKQIVLYQALGEKVPEFAHLPLILGADKKRLSKRHGAADVLQFQELGYLPEALINFLALLGWSLNDKDMYFSLDELCSVFDLERVSSSPSVFDMQHLDSFNAYYLRQLSSNDLEARLIPFMNMTNPCIQKLKKEYLHKLIAFQCERNVTLKTIGDSVMAILEKPSEYLPKAMKKAKKSFQPELVLSELLTVFPDLDFDQTDLLEEKVRALAEKHEMKLLAFAQVMRLALVGCFASPPIFDLLSILGKETVLKRLQKLQAFLAEKMD